MRLVSFVIMILLSVYYLNCNENNSNSFDSGINNMLFPEPGSGLPASQGKIILNNGTGKDQYKIDSYKIDEAEITGDSVHFRVTYGGGCKEHDFSLVAFNYFLESYPVQANIVLTHDSHDDPCDALITRRKVSFGLSPLRDEYNNFYRTNDGTIILTIFSDKESETPLKLNYQLN